MTRRIALAVALLLVAGTAEASGGRRGVAASLRARLQRKKPARPPRHAAASPAADAPRAAARPTSAREVLSVSDPETPRRYAELRAALEDALSPGDWQRFAGMTWKPYELRSRWVGEHRPGFVSRGTERRQVAYLGRRARAKYRITVGEDGLLYDARGQRFEAGPLSPLVMDAQGNLYARDAADIARAASDPSALAFAHSSFLAGGPVAMSIEVEVKQGRVVHVKNRSGHYRPSRASFLAWIVGMERRGLDVSALRVSFDMKSTVEDGDPASFER